ncbi:brefeldin A-inhibited guanine nucleotide-exchange protein [Planoprotostelium fungivorum]|uniref:Brefeldin A-inhibited guanine nucleotide-exchange protein n=1 Tax=Planoprotostelium fungivorum TaxID=1890364 RepID=A0A2P6N2Y8_9EUKA|nr:brefeldin A-inhibited guanine nucleotide-exchange protein [Planoprotostelium fungivorum]
MLCLEGLRQNTTLSCTFNMDTERNAFVTTVTKFTFLQQSKEMKQKNIESIKTLMDVALTDGNYLHDSWLQILKCMSILEQLHLVGSGASTEAIPRFNSDDMRGSTGLSRNSASTRDLKRPVSMQVNYEMANAQMIAEHINAGAIDKIFSNSVNLNSTAIEEFTKALCQVSIEEISSANPRIFSLQKLVELAHFNMNRVRLVWSRVWNVLAAHFTKVGCDKSPHISMYAIDSLKQLAFKFLEKTELANYHFQKEFLKPFELIMANQSDVAIRDMVIRCLSNMVLARSHNIRSGWKSIFVVFTVAATDHDEAIVRLAFDMVQEINQKYFHMIADSFFVDCVNCLVAYGNGVIFIDVALKAIDSLSQCAKNLAEGKIVSVEAVSPTNPKVVFTENDRHLSLWFPVLTGLSGIVGHSHIDIRTSALRSLFTILETYGSMFNRNFWELMFRGVLLPIFDNVRYAGGADLLKEDNEWLTTTCLLALNSLIELFSAFFVDISFLLGEFLNLLVSCILQENESLARIGATCFLQLVMTNGTKFDEEMWTLVCTKLSHILENNSPVELTSHSSDFQKIVSDTPASPVIVEGTEDISSRSTMVTTAKGLRSKCTVQLGLIEALNEIAFTHYLSLTTDHLSALLDSLEKCYAFCRQVNHDPTIRIRIEKYGLVDLMLRKETTAVSCYLRVLFRMYGETQKDSAKRNQLAEARLFTKCSEIITDYMKRFGDSASVKVDNKKIITVYNHIIIQIIKGLLETYDEQLKKHTSSLYPLLCELILCDQSKDLRVVLRKMMIRMGTIHELCPQPPNFVVLGNCLVACPHLDPDSLVTISVRVNNRSSTGGQAGGRSTLLLHIQKLEQERKATTHIPLEIWDALKAINMNYDWNVQQDSSEIQGVMWEALDAITPILIPGSCFSLVHNVKVNTIFTCQTCQGTHNREEGEKGFQMSCANGERGMFVPYRNVQTMVDHHFDVEGSYSRCESCKVDSMTRTRAMKGEGPDVLPIYLKRTAHDQGGRSEEGQSLVNQEKHLQVSSAVYVKERLSEEKENIIRKLWPVASRWHSLTRRCIVEVLGSYEAKDMRDLVEKVHSRQTLRASQKIRDDRKRKDIQRRAEKQELKKNREVNGNAESQKVPPRPSKPRQSTSSRAEPQRVHRPTRMPDTLI